MIDTVCFVISYVLFDPSPRWEHIKAIGNLLQEVVTLSTRFPLIVLMVIMCLLGMMALAQDIATQQAINIVTLNTGDAKDFITWLTKQPTLANKVSCTVVDTRKVLVRAKTKEIMHAVYEQVKLFDAQPATTVAEAPAQDAGTQTVPETTPTDDAKTYEIILPLRYMDANAFEQLFSPNAKTASDAHWEPYALTQETVEPQTFAHDHSIHAVPDTNGLLNSFIPDGAGYQILDHSHMLLTAQSPKELALFRDFIRMIDRKPEKVSLTIYAVKLSADQQSMVGITFTDKSLVAPVYLVPKPRMMIDAMIKQKQIELLATGKADIADGDRGFVELLLANLPGVAIQELLIHPDNSVTIGLQPLMESVSEKTDDGMVINTVDPQRSASQLRVRVKEDEMVMLGARGNLFLLITPHVLDETQTDTDQ